MQYLEDHSVQLCNGKIGNIRMTDNTLKYWVQIK